MLLRLLVFLLLGGLALHAQLGPNVAVGKTATQSSQYNDFVAERAIDGNTNGDVAAESITHTETELNARWDLDLGSDFQIGKISLYNRTDCCQDRLSNYYVFVAATPFSSIDPTVTANDESVATFYFENAPLNALQEIAVNEIGQYVRVQLAASGILSLAEVEVYEQDGPMQFQAIYFPPIATKRTTDEAFNPSAISSGSQAISYTIIEGAASVNGQLISIDGPGLITVQANQEGNESFLAANPVQQSFEAIDPETIEPIIQIISPTTAYPIYQPELSEMIIKVKVEIEHPELFSIENVVISDGQNSLDVKTNGTIYWATWTPTLYNDVNFTAIAVSEHGTSASSFATVPVLSEPFGNTTVNTFDNALISFGAASRSYSNSYDLPSFVGGYNQIIGHLDVTCPIGGCDPYDRKAWIEVKDDEGSWIEIIRYITPFGRACDHTVDLSQYLDLLQGNREFRMFIDTWAGGWEITLDLEYVTGTPDYKYSKVTRLWDGAINMGDPNNLQPADTLTVGWQPTTEIATLWMMSSGHGWGNSNTGNAAEFYYATHHVYVDGENTFDQETFYDCDPNPDDCSPQPGTWEFDRSGWCPGAIGKVHEFNMSAFIGTDSTELMYIMHPGYVDLCHPNNPDCVNGVPNGCDCAAGFNPHYEVAANLIEQGNTIYLPEALEEVVETGISETASPSLRLLAFPNPASDQIEIACFDQVDDALLQIINVQGQIIMSFEFGKQRNGFQQLIDFQSVKPGLYFAKVIDGKRTRTTNIIVQ